MSIKIAFGWFVNYFLHSSSKIGVCCMLIHDIVNYCNLEFNSKKMQHRCYDCNHPSHCPGNCKKCLEEVHYPSKHPNGKIDYDCQTMIYFYVCDYINKYASEMLYLIRRSTKLENINNYHILSIGCGAAPDLMAFEKYIIENQSNKTIEYFGIDKNPLWKNIQTKITEYPSNIITNSNFMCTDVMEYLSSNSINSLNVIVFQYVISHFYNTNQIDLIERFFTDIVNNVVATKNLNEPLIILINDANSCYRGRNYFMDLTNTLSKSGYHGTYMQFYFDYNIKHSCQRYGEMHLSNDVLFNLGEFDLQQYVPWDYCSSAQLLIEIE